jgi:hypothetical protein
MTAQLSTTQQAPALSLVEKAIINGNLKDLNPAERMTHYMNVCNSLGLNPHTQPFGYIELQGKLTLYAKRECTEQLRKVNGVSIQSLEGRLVDDLYIVTATACDKTGRVDTSTGAVPLKGLAGEAKANAIMKAETKAKRRVTLSICGLGMLDESEAPSVAGARTVDVQQAHVEILPQSAPVAGALPEAPPAAETPTPAQDPGLAEGEWKPVFTLTPEEKEAAQAQGWQVQVRHRKKDPTKADKWYLVPAEFQVGRAQEAAPELPEVQVGDVDALALATAIQTAESKAALAAAWAVILKVQKSLDTKTMTSLAKARRDKEATL